jgi:hypothetical protein
MTTVSPFFNDSAGGTRAKATGIYGLLVAGNLKDYYGAGRGKLSPLLQ